MKGVVVASAPGKIILFGEHAVVSGEIALATCLSLRTWCTVTDTPAKDIVELEVVFEGPVRCSWSVARLASFAEVHKLVAGVVTVLSAEFLASLGQLASEGFASMPLQHKNSVNVFLLLYFLTGSPSRSLCARVWSTLPIGAGLGSSAAYSASVCGALARAGGIRFCRSKRDCGATPCAACKETLNAWTFQAERILHGNPSGIDNSVAVFGGCLSYTKVFFIFAVLLFVL